MKNQIVEMKVIQGRHIVRIDKQPNASNNYTLSILFDDGTPSGADWYEIELKYISR